MKWGNLGSLKYREDLNALYEQKHGKRAIAFVVKYGDRAIRNGLKIIVEDITTKSEGDVHLEAFLAQSERIQRFIRKPPGFSIIVYPSKGEVEKYELTKKEFFTNIHKNPDPLIVQDIRQKIYLHPIVTDDVFWVPGKKWAPNIVEGAIFFKKNPFLNYENYPGFKEFVDECINKEKEI